MSKPYHDSFSAIIDWLEFTVTGLQLESVILEILKLEKKTFTKMETGRFGYHSQLKWNEGSLYIMFNAGTDKNENVIENLPQNVDQMGIHVMITGSGCRQYESLYELKTLLFYLTILDDKVNFSRVDIAIDDFKNQVIKFSRIHQAAVKGYFTSRWNKWDEINSRQCSTGEFLGRTMYFGSQSSEIFCRIYDKTLERKAKSEEKTAESATWTRLEVVYRKERARKLIYHIIDQNMSVGTAIRGTLKQYLRFIKPPQTNDTNKARWPSTKWWGQLLDNVEKLQLTSRREPKSIDNMASWLDRQIAPTIAAIITAYEGDIDWLHQIIKNGASRLSQRHKDAIAQYLQQEVEE